MSAKKLTEQQIHEKRITKLEGDFVVIGRIVKRLQEDVRKVMPKDPAVEAWFEKHLGAKDK